MMGIPLDEMLVWDPDEPMGGLTPRADHAMAKMLLWKGHCSVHQMFQAQHILQFPQPVPGRHGDLAIRNAISRCASCRTTSARPNSSSRRCKDAQARHALAGRHRAESGQPHGRAVEARGQDRAVHGAHGVHVLDHGAHRPAASGLDAGKSGRRQGRQSASGCRRARPNWRAPRSSACSTWRSACTRAMQRRLLQLVACSDVWRWPLRRRAGRNPSVTDRSGAAASIRSRVPKRQLAANAAVAWQVLTDYNHLAEFVPDMRVSRVVSAPGEPLRHRATRARPAFCSSNFTVNVVLEIDGNAAVAGCGFRAIRGNMRRMQGEWRIDTGRQRHPAGLRGARSQPGISGCRR